MAEWVRTRVELKGRGFDRWFLDSGKPGNVDYSMSLRGPLRAPTLGVEPNRRR